MYDLAHLPASCLHSERHARELAGLVGRFAMALQDRAASEEPHGLWPGLRRADARALRLAATALTASADAGSSSGSSSSVVVASWFPEHGCALLAQGAPRGTGAANAHDSGADTAHRDGHSDDDNDDDDNEGDAAEEEDIRPRPGDVALRLVCLDGWELRAHSLHGL
ncbi:hypothetical protein GPECTOR_91g552 [Gonium pectorale]|uniref:Uncharacterized protein n=1 Tax=Gonium pectorale TaxID=33097 RepID=A0A150G0N7_GONPE|nr:hypothetical protein GPECTOR_91g552 [Gonium pectorale]|eukprot:KXZ43398.1 hypothetical protein GPECTOR_91g552 [Gonium pectorale]